MRSKQFVLKAVAVFLSINILSQVLAPTAAWALTSGPTTPEVASFEPVDTTDMVNLVTGDFTYNVPLLEVPGPEGGYPLSLNYHAGIMPAQDASWVGLGWNLNPGCVNRTANNFADDYNGATLNVIDTWPGGQTLEETFGVGVGIDDIASVGVNVGVQTDTYKGTAGIYGFQMGIGIEGSNFGVGVGYEWGGLNNESSMFVYAGSNSTGLSIQYAQGSQGGQSFQSVSMVSNFTQSSLGIDMSSSGTKFSATPTSIITSSSSKSDHISTSSGGFNLCLPIYCFYVSLGVKYTTYWIYSNASSSLYGVLNSYNGNQAAQNQLNGSGGSAISVNYDCSVLIDPNAGMAEQGDRNWSSNASVPSYDTYIISGQGISGAIEPTILDNGSFFRPNVEDPASGGWHYEAAFPRQFTKPKQFFRFINDFSNSHTIYQSTINFGTSGTYSTPYLSSTDLAYTVENIDSRGYIKTLNSSSNVTEARFTGSKHVEFYTNEQITNHTARLQGFIDSPDAYEGGYGRGDANGNISIPDYTGNHTVANNSFLPFANSFTQYNISNNIGGYTITNEKGVSYHYALPAYTFNFHQVQVNPVDKGQMGISERETKNPAPYAYTWLLTAVTGPDYVDINENGYADAADWGYWVTFDYGRFQANAGFGSPEVGWTKDIDGSAVYSTGAKEIFYLDAISTRTHTALFIKDRRSDGKGTNGFNNLGFNCSNLVYNAQGLSGTSSQVFPATNTLKLDEIILIDNTKLNTVLSNNSIASLVNLKNNTSLSCNCSFSTGSGTTPLAYIGGNSDCILNPYNTFYYSNSLPGSANGYGFQSLYYNVLDMGDVNGTQNILTQLRANSQKDIQFSYLYSLCPYTSNSYLNDGDQAYYQNLLGKLTLNCLSFYGNNGVQLMPSTSFGYDLTNPISAPITINQYSGNNIWNITTSASFALGDIITFQGVDVWGNPATFYGCLIANPSSGNFQMQLIGPAILQSITSNYLTNATQTKNPAYSQTFVDSWGFFKSDYNPSQNVTNINQQTATTPISAKSVDCWSLRTINTPTGATINIQYQSDDYSDIVLKNYSILNVNVPQIQLSTISGYSFNGPYQCLINNPSEPYTWNYQVYPAYPAIIAEEGMNYTFPIAANDLQQPLTNIIQVNDVIDVVASIVYNYVVPGSSGSNNNLLYNIPAKVPLKVIGVTGNSVTVTDPNNLLIVNPSTGNALNGSLGNLAGGGFSIYGMYIIPDRRSNLYDFIPGGGVRASVISVTDGSTVKTTNYGYGNGSNSFGSTSYEPNSMNELQPLQPQSQLYNNEKNASASQFTLEALYAYQDAYYASYAKIMGMAKDLVAPGVMYSNVSVQNSVTKNGTTTNAPVYQVYQFQPFTVDMIQANDLLNTGFMPFTNNTINTGLTTIQGTGGATLRTIQITNNMSKLGNLLSVKTYDRNSNLLSEMANTYTSTPPNNQGRVDQVFNEQRKMNPTGNWPSYGKVNNEFHFATATLKTELPSVLQSTTKIDYVKGLSTTTNNIAYDFYSGAVTETQTTDSYGKTYISITEPAYNYYGGMGIKLNNFFNTNMLSQTTANYTLKSLPATQPYTCNVVSIGNYGTEFTVNLSGSALPGLPGFLPMNYHIGSAITFTTSYNSQVFSFPSYITSINDTRTSFNVVGPASLTYEEPITIFGAQAYIPLPIMFPTGSVTINLNQGTILSSSVASWNNNWNYRMPNATNSGYVYQSMTDNSNTVQNENVWRKKSSYVWNSPYTNVDGSYMSNNTTGSYVPFQFTNDYSGGTQSSYWSKLSTNTLFSYNSKPLERTDVNGRYSSTKFCNNERYLLATASNAKYTEFTHSGAEFTEPVTPPNSLYTEGEVFAYGTQSDNAASPNSSFAHTGIYSFGIQPGTYISYTVPYSQGSTLPTGFTAGQKYRASVWVNANSIGNAQLYATVTDNSAPIVTSTVTVTVATVANPVKCGNWYLLTLSFNAPSALAANSIVVGVTNTAAVSGQGFIYVDDFRFQPDVSSVTSYVYDQNTGLVAYVLDANNRYTRYAYDNRNRLTGIYKETTYGEVPVSQYSYNYALPFVPCQPTQ